MAPTPDRGSDGPDFKSGSMYQTGQALPPVRTHGHDRRMEWLQYYRRVLARAWAEAVALLFPDIRGIVFRDGPIFLLTLVGMYFLRPRLVSEKFLATDANPLADNLIPWVLAIFAVPVVFTACFIVEALFISPSRLWKEQKERIETLEAGAREARGGKLTLAEFITQRATFTLVEAACILAGHPLQQPPLQGVVHGVLLDLKEAAIQHRLPVSGISRDLLQLFRAEREYNLGQDHNIPDHAFISKDDLRQFAEQRGTVIPGL